MSQSASEEVQKPVNIKGQKVKLLYPFEHKELHSVFCNHVQVFAVGNEVYLDFAQTQPQKVLTHEAEVEVEAPVLSRVIVSIKVVERFVEVMKKVLAAHRGGDADQHEGESK